MTPPKSVYVVLHTRACRTYRAGVPMRVTASQKKARWEIACWSEATHRDLACKIVRYVVAKGEK